MTTDPKPSTSGPAIRTFTEWAGTVLSSLPGYLGYDDYRQLCQRAFEAGAAEAERDYEERLAQERAEFNSYAAADLEVRFDALRSAADALISMLDATVSPAGPGRYELPSGRLNRAVNRYRKARRALDVD